jgi:hypothetical protein
MLKRPFNSISSNYSASFEWAIKSPALKAFRLALFLILSSVLYSTISCKSQKKPSYPFNLDFEHVDSLQQAADWSHDINTYSFYLDSSIKFHGSRSMCISGSEYDNYGRLFQVSDIPANGEFITLTGYMKTSEVSGFARLMLREENDVGEDVAWKDLEVEEIRGTTQWKLYRARIPVNPESNTLTFGAVLVGTGKVWIDSMQLTVDGKPIVQVTKKPRKIVKDESDPQIENASNELTKPLNNTQLQRLSTLCEVWGFLKYYRPHHEEYSEGWDSILFKTIPLVINAGSVGSFENAIESLVDFSGRFQAMKINMNPFQSQPTVDSITTKYQPDYAHIFDNDNFSIRIRQRLDSIRQSPLALNSSMVVQAPRIGNPIFKIENQYSLKNCPSTAIRVLALFRYWSLIQYYYPYRYLLKDSWKGILSVFIPRFISANNPEIYLKTLLELIGAIHDAHAFVQSPELDSLKGKYLLPFRANFVQGKLLVTGFYDTLPEVKSLLFVGDIITRIDRIQTDSLVLRYLPFTQASNYAGQLELLTSYDGMLMRNRNENVLLTVSRNELFVEIPVRCRELSAYYDELYQEKFGFRLLGKIGYMFPAKLKETDYEAIRKAFSGTKGIIIDLRCYPSVFMPITYGHWFKSGVTPFAKLGMMDFSVPGGIKKPFDLSNGSEDGDFYKGKLVILVNAKTISQSEWTTMAFQSNPLAWVVGSQTAGADGNVSPILLPGNVRTAISGLGVYYPDGGETQRLGVRINIPVTPTIAGIKAGRDEILERAISLINSKR